MGWEAMGWACGGRSRWERVEMGLLEQARGLPSKCLLLPRFAKFGVDGIVPPRERPAVELADSPGLTSLIAQWSAAEKSESLRSWTDLLLLISSLALVTT